MHIISVEWLFGDIINYFKFLDFKKNLKIGLCSIGKMCIVSALLQNSLTSLYGKATRQPRFLVVNPWDFLITLHKPKENNYLFIS